MRLTEEQYRSLEQYEQNMRTALRSSYARNPGRIALLGIQDIYNDVAKVNNRINVGCSVCILNLLKDVGRIYFADKEERERLNSVRPPVKSAETPRIPRVGKKQGGNTGVRKKVPVKTSR